MPLNFNLKRPKDNSGFTFLELLIAMTIVATLATLAFSGFAQFKELARIARCCEEIRSLEREIAAYATEKGDLPPNLAALSRLDLKDPWGNPYHYYPAALPVDPSNAGPNNRIDASGTINTDFDLYSLGPTGAFTQSIVPDESQDDVIRGNDGGFVGQAKDYYL